MSKNSFYNQLVVQEKELEEALEAIRKLIEYYDGSNHSNKSAHNQPKKISLFGETEQTYNEYNNRWNWIAKIKFVLGDVNKCITTKNIVELIGNYEPQLIKDKDAFKSTRASISATITNHTKPNKSLLRYSPYDGGDYLIGLREWFNNDKSVKDKYRGER